MTAPLVPSDGDPAAAYTATLNAIAHLPAQWRKVAARRLRDENPFADEAEVSDEMLADYQRCMADWDEP